MRQIDLTSMFFENVVGRAPDKEAPIIITEGTIEYLKDNGFSNGEILKLFKSYKGQSCMAPENLPESIWEGSLTRPDVFYFHRALQLVSKPATVNIDGNRIQEPFYMEMRCRFTMDDLLDYFYKTLQIDKGLKDNKRDKGQMEYLLNKYKDINGMDALDFILILIDYAKGSSKQTFSIFDIQENEAEAYTNMQAMVREAHKDCADRIYWRGHSRCHSLNSAG